VAAEGQESGDCVPHSDPSRLDAVIQELKVCQSLWKEDREQAKESVLKVIALEKEVAQVWGWNESKSSNSPVGL
jgi:hypothetical protein